MSNPTAQQWYERAYQLHYKVKAYREAYASYLLVAKCFSDTKEAQYAYQQMNNIRNLNIYSEEFDSYAEDFTKKYYDIDKMIEDITFRIEEGINSFPPEFLIECNLAILSKDDRCLYFCGYGKLNKQIDKILNGLDINNKIAVTKELVDSVLLNDPVFIIPLNNIIYFQEKGDLSYSTSISGGGGGSKSMSVAGAVAGKLMFGDVGAIIGSRAGTGVKIDEIHSETVEHDNRYVVLRYLDSDKGYCDIQMEYDCYEALNKLIPEKEYSYVSINAKPNMNNGKENERLENKSNEIPVKQLKDLKYLLDEGIITQEDFDAKKRQLLGI